MKEDCLILMNEIGFCWFLGVLMCEYYFLDLVIYLSFLPFFILEMRDNVRHWNDYSRKWCSVEEFRRIFDRELLGNGSLIIINECEFMLGVTIDILEF